MRPREPVDDDDLTRHLKKLKMGENHTGPKFIDNFDDMYNALAEHQVQNADLMPIFLLNDGNEKEIDIKQGSTIATLEGIYPDYKFRKDDNILFNFIPLITDNKYNMVQSFKNIESIQYNNDALLTPESIEIEKNTEGLYTIYIQNRLDLTRKNLTLMLFNDMANYDPYKNSRMTFDGINYNITYLFFTLVDDNPTTIKITVVGQDGEWIRGAHKLVDYLGGYVGPGNEQIVVN